MKAVAYARYSTDKQDENSIEYQINAIKDYCSKNSIQLSNVYFDEAASGTNTNRSDFNNMLFAAKRREFDTVIIYDITRGSRDVADWFEFRKTMASLGIQVISIKDRLGDLHNPNDFLSELLTVGIGHHHVLVSREKSIAGTASRAQHGVFLGGTAPLGYDIEDGKYVINNSEAEIVRKIYKIYAAGGSYNDILSAVKGFKGKKGASIGKNSLHSILTNERYIGVYTWNKRCVKMLGQWAGGKPNPNCVRIEDMIPPIIDKNTWNEVQKRMSNNKRNATNKAKYDYLLSGLIECQRCGGTYVGHCSTNKKGYKTRYYTCGNKYRTHECDARNINADEIEVFVVHQLKAYLTTTDAHEIAKQICSDINGASDDLKKEKKELREITEKINNGVKAILGGMDFPELETEVNNLRVRKSELEDIIFRRETNKAKISEKDIVTLFDENIKHFDDDLKNVIKNHITKIYTNGSGDYTVNVGVHINGCGGTQQIICTTYTHQNKITEDSSSSDEPP